MKDRREDKVGLGVCFMVGTSRLAFQLLTALQALCDGLLSSGRARTTSDPPHRIHAGYEKHKCMNEPIDSRQLRAFATLARNGSFTRTAAELYLTQSAVSHSIRSLEESVGCRLLDRVGKKVTLTHAGEHLLGHADKILQEMFAARRSLDQLSKWGRTRLRVGASATACQHILPPVLTEFKKSYPQCHITIEPCDTPEVRGLLRDRKIDLGIALEARPDDAQVEFVPLFWDELRFIVGREHPWARAGQARKEEISSQNYILYDAASFTFRMIEAYFREEELTLNTLIQLGNIEAIKELVKLGMGVSILAPWVARDEILDGSLIALSLGRRRLKRRWGVVYSRSSRLGLPEETFVKLCQKSTATFGIEDVREIVPS